MPARTARATRTSKPREARTYKDVRDPGDYSEPPGRTPRAQSRGSGGIRDMNRQVSKDVSPAAPQLFAQYLICAIFITVGVMTDHDEYLARASQVLWRLSSVTMLYFILALASMTKSLNKVTVQFGWLIVAVIFLKSVTGIGRVFNVLAGQGTGEDTSDLTSDNTSGGVTPDTHTFLS